MTHVADWKTAVSTQNTDLAFFQRLMACDITAIEFLVGEKVRFEIDWQALRRNADGAGIEIWSCHLPFSQDIDISLAEEENRRSVVNDQKKIMAEAMKIGIRRFVLHPSSEPIGEEERPLRMEKAKESLRELAQFAAEGNAVICVEDLPRTCLGHTADEVAELIAADERLKVCFDVNHLLAQYGSTHAEFIEKLGHKIETTHMSDYDFVDEKHFFPGRGMINWRELAEGLERADYAGPFLYEGGFTPSHRAPEVPCGTLEEARNRHLTIKELTGK